MLFASYVTNQCLQNYNIKRYYNVYKDKHDLFVEKLQKINRNSLKEVLISNKIIFSLLVRNVS
jgi:hypothetical protein